MSRLEREIRKLNEELKETREEARSKSKQTSTEIAGKDKKIEELEK